MKFVITCGIFLMHDGKLLIGHPTGAPMTQWSIPKGVVEGNENHVDAAIREFREEAGVDVIDLVDVPLIDIGSMRYTHASKYIHGYVAKMVADPSRITFVCNSLVNNSFPEIDVFKWVTIEEAYKLIHHAQVHLLRRYISNPDYWNKLTINI